MLTTGIIKQINVDSKNHKNNKYIVDIGLFKSPGDLSSEYYSYEANACVLGGIYSPYNVGDKVYIEFFNGQGGYPVILGKIYQGLEDEARNYAYFDTLKVKNKVHLPENTTLGDITVNDIKDLRTSFNALSERYYNEGIIKKTIMAQTPVKNLHGFSDLYYDYITTTDGKIKITYEGNAALTDEQIKFYMKYITGVAYIPDDLSEIQNNSIYRGGVIFSGLKNKNDGKGFGGYYVTEKVPLMSTTKYLEIIRTHSFNNGLTKADVEKIIEAYIGGEQEQ